MHASPSVQNVAPDIPAVVRSQVAQAMPSIPDHPEGWVLLHRAHVQRLQAAWGAILTRLGLDGVMIHSGLSPLRYSRDDQHWPTTMTPSFLHWCPYAESPAVLVIRPGEKPKLITERHNSFWEGPAPRSQTWDLSSFVIETVDDLAAMRWTSGFGFVGDDVKLGVTMGIAIEQCNRDDVMRAIEAIRTLKSDYEAASIRKAAMVAARGHNALRALFQSVDSSEFGLHIEYLRVTEQSEFSLPYGNIVAMMDHCSILHHIHHDRHPVEGDASLLVDAGAAFNGYASDITRTWVRGYGSMTSLFRDLVSGVDRVQRRLVEGVVVGRRFEDLHNEAHVFLAELLIDLKVLSCGVQQALESGLSRLFFPHGLGHSLGIQVHDVGMKLTKPAPENPFLRNTSELTAGQVVTIEPGVYFIPQLMKEALSGDKRRMVNQSLIEGLMPFGGVRIEDDILVTAKGALNLTRDLVSNQD